MDGYYDHHPLLQLDRPVALYGLLSDETRAVGYRASSLCGLRFADTTRLLEHRKGQSADALEVREGAPALRAEEATSLREALADRPFGVITLGQATLLDAASLELVRARTTLVALDLDLPSLFWRVRARQEQAARGEGAPLPAELAEVTRIEELRAYHEPRSRALDAAQHRIPARGRSVEQLARALSDWLLDRAAN
ncbi:MAG TPA: shikimate kinase [Thermoanaerobaculia bacterium]|nr:shikimate kinase [Thermoanaerobaculia bacterium]